MDTLCICTGYRHTPMPLMFQFAGMYVRMYVHMYVCMYVYGSSTIILGMCVHTNGSNACSCTAYIRTYAYSI